MIRHLQKTICIRVITIPLFLTSKKVLYLQALKVCISGTSMEQAEIINFLNYRRKLGKNIENYFRHFGSLQEVLQGRCFGFGESIAEFL